MQRQLAGNYESADLEDRYEARYPRRSIDRKLKGEGIDLETEATGAPANDVIDLLAALKRSLGQSPAEMPAQPKRKKADDGRQTGLILKIKGGKRETVDKTAQLGLPTRLRRNGPDPARPHPSSGC